MSPRRPRQPEYVRSQEEIDRMDAEARAWRDNVESVSLSDARKKADEGASACEKGAYDKALEEPMPKMFVRETALMDRPAAERFPPLIEYTMNKLRHNLFALDDHEREIRQLRTGTRQVLARLSAAA